MNNNRSFNRGYSQHNPSSQRGGHGMLNSAPKPASYNPYPQTRYNSTYYKSQRHNRSNFHQPRYFQNRNHFRHRNNQYQKEIQMNSNRPEKKHIFQKMVFPLKIGELRGVTVEIEKLINRL